MGKGNESVGVAKQNFTVQSGVERAAAAFLHRCGVGVVLKRLDVDSVEIFVKVVVYGGCVPGMVRSILCGLQF